MKTGQAVNSISLLISCSTYYHCTILYHSVENERLYRVPRPTLYVFRCLHCLHYSLTQAKKYLKRNTPRIKQALTFLFLLYPVKCWVRLINYFKRTLSEIIHHTHIHFFRLSCTTRRCSIRQPSNLTWKPKRWTTPRTVCVVRVVNECRISLAALPSHIDWQHATFGMNSTQSSSCSI